MASESWYLAKLHTPPPSRRTLEVTMRVFQCSGGQSGSVGNGNGLHGSAARAYLSTYHRTAIRSDGESLKPSRNITDIQKPMGVRIRNGHTPLSLMNMQDMTPEVTILLMIYIVDAMQQDCGVDPECGDRQISHFLKLTCGIALLPQRQL